MRRSGHSRYLRRLRPSRTTGAFTLLGLWAFGPPILVQSDEDGGWSISLGASTGQYEVVSRNCSGDLLSSAPVEVRTGGAVVEYETSNVRLALFGGVNSATGEPPRLDGMFGGGMVAYEGGGVGIGAGAVHLPRGTVPSFYLRLGKRDKGHFRTDFLAPDPTPGVTGLLRAGVGFPIGSTRALVGASTGRALDLDDPEGDVWDNGGPFAELGVPLGRRLEASLRGSYFFSEQYADWAAGVALRFRPN